MQRKVAIKQERLEIQNTLADEEYRILREMKAKNLSHVPSVFEILEDTPTEKSFILELLGKCLLTERLRSGQTPALPAERWQGDAPQNCVEDPSKKFK